MSMPKEACELVNRSGERVEFLCGKNKQNITQQVIGPKDQLFSPIFLKGNHYFYICYKQEQWFLLK